ncbi:MAG: sulfotransferase domain-containing protein [Planctomycetota bacterium]
MNRKLVPTFIGIGGQRCRSSWIHKILSEHPDIYVSPLKELQYFTWRAGQESLDWYLKNFEQSAEYTARGEITPTYSMVSRAVVDRVAKLFPALRLFMTIRNPVDRAWSYFVLKKTVLGHGRIRLSPAVHFFLWLERKRVRLPSDYVRALDHWEGAFGTGSVRVWTFEEMASTPEQVLCELFEHLGVTSGWLPSSHLIQKRVLSSGSQPMPPVCRWYLSRQYLPMVRQLNYRLNGRVAEWVSDLESWASDTSLAREFAWLANRYVLSLPERLVYSIHQSSRERRTRKALDEDIKRLHSQ